MKAACLQQQAGTVHRLRGVTCWPHQRSPGPWHTQQRRPLAVQAHHQQQQRIGSLLSNIASSSSSSSSSCHSSSSSGSGNHHHYHLSSSRAGLGCRQPQAAAAGASAGTPPRPDVCCRAAAAAAVPMPAQRPGGLAKLLAHVRAALFAAWTFTLAVPLFVTMLAMALPVMAIDKFRRLAQHFVNNLWAIASTSPFYRVEIVGREHLPAASTPAVYVANHQSFMDIYSLFHLQRPFKFISKTSNFLIPIVGWSMFLTGHVKLNRVDRRSQLKCLQTCIEMLSHGASVLFFPEGTRSKDQVMQGFKKGAFSVAVKAGVPVVPITLVGTGNVMPSGREGEMYGGDVKIVVHPMIPAAGRDADKVCEEARAVIASALPPHLVARDDEPGGAAGGALAST